MLPWAWARKNRSSNDTSARSPVNRPRTALSNRSRASGCFTPDRAIQSATVCWSHSAARSAVHGASTGTVRASLSIRRLARTRVRMAHGLILGIRPV